MIEPLIRAAGGAVDGAVEQFEQAIWQAPAVVVRDLAPLTARRWHKHLAAAGLSVHCQPSQHAVPASPLLDAAICPRNDAGQQRLQYELAAFFGVTSQCVLRQLQRHPGWILRGVSTPSIQALRRRFDSADVAVRICDPATARFDLDTRDMGPAGRAAVVRGLAMLGLRSSASLPGYLATSLRDSFAAQGLRLIERGFRSHVVRLTAPPRGAAACAAGMVLSRRSAEALAQASRRAPLDLDRGLDVFEAREAAAAYQAVGLQVDVAPEPLMAGGAESGLPSAIPPRAARGATPRRGGGSAAALAVEGLLQQLDEGAQPVGQGAGAGVDDADLHRLAAPLGQQPDQTPGSNVIPYDIFRKQR